MSKTKRRLRLTPSVGLKQFSGRFGIVFMAVLAAAYAYFNIRFTNIESAISANSGETLLRSAAAIALPAGMLVAFICSKFKYEFVAPLYGLLAVAGALAINAYYIFPNVFSETSSLWRLEVILELFAICACFFLVFTLILANFNVRITPQIGVIAAIGCLLAAAILLIRVVLTVTTLKSVIGDNYDFTLAISEFSSEVNWLFRNITIEKATAEAYNARIIERIALACIYAAGIPFALSYKNFFEVYNREMDFSADLPDGYIEVEQRVKRPKKVKEKIDNRFSEMPSRGTNTRIDPNESSYRRTKRGASFDDIFESDDQSDDESKSSDNSSRFSTRNPDRRNRTAQEEDDSSFIIPELRPQPRTSSAPVKKVTVKVKGAPQKRPSFPKADDDIWNNYTD